VVEERVRCRRGASQGRRCPSGALVEHSYGAVPSGVGGTKPSTMISQTIMANEVSACSHSSEAMEHDDTMRCRLDSRVSAVGGPLSDFGD
jgi:hypothetical protein